MGCFGTGFNLLYAIGLLVMAGGSRHPEPVFALGFALWLLLRGLVAAFSDMFGLVDEPANGELPLRERHTFRNLLRLRERIVRVHALGRIGAGTLRSLHLSLGKIERGLGDPRDPVREDLRLGPLGAAGGDLRWLDQRHQDGDLSAESLAALRGVDLGTPFPVLPSESDLEAEEARPGQEEAAPTGDDAETAVEEPEAESASASDSEDEGSDSSQETSPEEGDASEIVFLPDRLGEGQAPPSDLPGTMIEAALEAARSAAAAAESGGEGEESPDPSSETSEAEPSGGQEVALSPGVTAWVPEASPADLDPSWIEGEPVPPTPGFLDHLRAKFMEEGQVRWAEAFSALFSLLAFVTGVVSAGYYWGHFHPHLRFAFLVLGASAIAFLATRVHRSEGLEETGRTLGVIAHLLAPVSLGALPFLVTAAASNGSFTLALLLAGGVLHLALGRTSAFTLGAHTPVLPRAYLAAAVFATLLPKLLVDSPLRGLLLVGACLAWLGREGSRTGPGEELPGGRLIRLCMPVYLMLVALGAAHPVRALEAGAWAFGAAVVGFLLWNAALAAGAGGDEFPGLPLGLKAAGFACMALAVLASYLVEPSFWGNTWMLASLAPGFLAATVSACVTGGSRPAYVSAVLLTVMAVLGAGPELGAHSTLILLPVAGCALGSAYLEVRGPGAARAYERASLAMLCYMAAMGIRAPLEGLTSSVALLAGVLPMVLVLRSRRAAFLASGAVAGTILFGVSGLWVLPSRVGLPPLGAWAGSLAAAPWLALAAAAAALVQVRLGPWLRRFLRPSRRRDWTASEQPVGYLHLPLALAALPGTLVALLHTSGWSTLPPQYLPGAPGMAGLWPLGLGLLAASATGLVRTLEDRPGAAHLVAASLVLGSAVLGASLAGISGMALGLALAALALAELAVRAAEGSPAGAAEGELVLPLPAGTLLAGGAFLALVLLPDLAGRLLLPGWDAPLAGPPLAAGIFLLVGHRLNRAAPFAAHLHLGPLLVAYATWSLTRGMAWGTRLEVQAVLAALMAGLGILPSWQSFWEEERSLGGGPASRGHRPLVQVPLALVGVVSLLAFPGLLEAATSVAQALAGALTGGRGSAGLVGGLHLLALGATLLLTRSRGLAIPGASLLGGGLAALGWLRLAEGALWPAHLQPASVLLSAGLGAWLLSEVMRVTRRSEAGAESPGDASEFLQALGWARGGLVLALVLGAASGASHHVLREGFYASLRDSWGGLSLTLGLLLVALSGWRGSRRETSPGALAAVSLGLAVGSAGAWLGGFPGATWGLALGTLGLALRALPRGGELVPGGPEGARLEDPWPLGTLVTGGFLVVTTLMVDLRLGTLGGTALVAGLSLLPAGYLLNRAAPFSLHLHLGAAAGLHAAWVLGAALPPGHRPGFLALAAAVLAALGLSTRWQDFLEREARGGGGPASSGSLPLVDLPLLGTLVVLVLGYQALASCFLETLSALVAPGFPPEARLPMHLPDPALGVLPLLGLGATWVLVSARIREGLMLLAYPGSLLLGYGLAPLLGACLPLESAGLARVLGVALAALALHLLQGKLARGTLPSLGTPLGSGVAGLLLGLVLSGAMIPADGVRHLQTPLLRGWLLALFLGSALAWIRAREPGDSWNTWPGAFLGGLVLHLGVVLTWRAQGWAPPALHHPEGSYLARLLLGYGLGLGLVGLRVATPAMGRHLAGVLSLLALGGLGGAFDWWDRRGFEMLDFQERQAFLGAVLAGAVVSLLRRGREGARNLVLLVVPVAYAGSGLDGAWPLGAAALCFYLGAVHAGSSWLTWPALALAALGGGATGSGLLRLFLGTPRLAHLWPLAVAAVLGAAVVAAAATWLASRDPGELDPGGRALACWPPEVLDHQATLLRRGLWALLALVASPLLLEQNSVLIAPGATPLDYTGSVALLAALTASLLAGGTRGPGRIVAALTWVVALQMGCRSLVPGWPPHALHALVALATLVACPGLTALGRRREDPDLGTAGLLGTVLVLWRLLGCLHFPGPDLWVALAAALPAATGAFLLREAVLRQQEILVYAGELAVGGSFLYLRTTGILGGSVYGQIGLQLVAFLLLGVAEKARGERWGILHTPFRRTALVLPAVVMVRCFFPLDWRGFDGWGQMSMAAMASALYGLVGIREDRAALRYLSGACLYLGLSLLLWRAFDLTRPWEHVDFYVVPLGLLVVLFSVLERENLLEEQQRTMRTVGLLLVYVSPALHAVWGATAPATVGLVLLGVLGIVVGQVAEIRLFTLYGLVAVGTGSGSYLLNIYRMARWNLAFLTFTTLAIGFGVYSARMRQRRREIGLD